MTTQRTIWSRVGCAVAGIALAGGALAQTPHIQVTEPGFKVFQFPKNQIPRIDGSFTDWDIVPDSYVVPIEEMWDDSRKHQGIDKSTLDIKVKVGDTVTKGQTVAILEAMKMENNINADREGQVVAINVEKGQSIAEGTDIITLG